MSFGTMVLQLAQCFLTSSAIFALTLLGAFPLGLLVYFGRQSRLKPLRYFIRAYISVMRGTPLILQLTFVFYGPSLLLGISAPRNWRFCAVIVSFVINYAAYFAEIYRGGIESIPAGQYEAAKILGYSRAQCFFKIILPQMIKRVLPSLTNEVITLVKDTSIAYAIGTVEMFTKARQIAVSPGSPGMLSFAVAAAFYFIFNYIVAFVMEAFERSLQYYR